MNSHTFSLFIKIAVFVWILLLCATWINAQTDSLVLIPGDGPQVVRAVENSGLSRNLPAVRRGTLIMASGEVKNFRSLRFSSDSVSFRIGKDPFQTEALDDIMQVSRKKWQPAQGAAIMGVVGGLTGIIMGTAIHL